MPPTLNIGVPTIASSLGLSVQVRMIPSWNGSNGVRDSNGKSMSSIQPTSSTEFNESASEFRPGEYGGARVAGGSILPVPVAGLYPSEADVNATSSRWMPSISRQMESMSLGSTDDFSFTSPSSGYVYGEETTYLEDEQSVNFAMYRFKVEKCSKQFVHDWKECPFAHEGETARRRNPFSHTSQPCPDFKNNKCCPRGNSCPMAHGPWEAGLHPDAYRTNMCAYGHECKRRMCFFAHDTSELRTPTMSTNFIQQQPNYLAFAPGMKPVVMEGMLRGVPGVSVGTSHSAVPSEATANKKVASTVAAMAAGGLREGSGVQYFAPALDQEFGSSSNFLQPLVLDGSDGDGSLQDDQGPMFGSGEFSGAGGVPGWQESVSRDPPQLQRMTEAIENNSVMHRGHSLNMSSSTEDSGHMLRKASSQDEIRGVGFGLGPTSAMTPLLHEGNTNSESLEFIGKASAAAATSELSAGASDSMKQDTSWVDKLLDSPMEPIRYEVDERSRRKDHFP
eukprot:CAMPEP_0113681152 /NCGR_PEP_ID=MMETSP0038_2-20120614/11797_1 /TAXON_ID=2898 /ORGANISM="Cryptomonas paramecium" /LENGTH=505 /DNA_ID=CAMNT_0000599775 /DNA_START=169 /DNA_END=1686 /DNA_ORIENTATION=+ /assembly_acc=CAM_ASM_000170